MSREIEVKILGVDVPEAEKTLRALGATFKGETLQKIYTYDLFPISSTFLSITETLKRNLGKKETELAKQKLYSLLTDLSGLLSADDRETILNIASVDLSTLAEQIINANSVSIIFDNAFQEVVSHYNTNPNKWVRLRESDGKVKIASKQIYNRKVVDGIRQHSINDVKEIEVEIDSLENGKLLLEELGYFHKNYQEKKRISYIIRDNVHVDIDSWPHIPPYIEIEAHDETMVFKVLSELGLKHEDARILNADDVYAFYGLDMYSYKELRFDNE